MGMSRVLTHADVQALEEFLGIKLADLAGEIHRMRQRGIEPEAIVAPVPFITLMGLPVHLVPSLERWSLVVGRRPGPDVFDTP